MSDLVSLLTTIRDAAAEALILLQADAPDAHPLVRIRHERGWTQADLALALNISRNLVSLIEIGQRRITAENARDWSEMLGIPKAQLRPDLFGEAA